MAKPAMVDNLEKAVASKMGPPSTVGPSTTPAGWSKGNKTGWGGAKVPPGLARVRARLAGGTVPMKGKMPKKGGM